MNYIALACINARVVSPILGFSSVERMDPALDLRRKMLTPEEVKYPEELNEARAVEGYS